MKDTIFRIGQRNELRSKNRRITDFIEKLVKLDK